MIFLYYHILENKYPVDTYIHVNKLELDWHILPQFLREYLEYQFYYILIHSTLYLYLQLHAWEIIIDDDCLTC